MIAVMAYAAAAVAAPGTPTASLGLQAQFEQATDALAARNWTRALSLFEAMERRPGVGQRTRGVIALRKALALMRLDREQDAVDSYRTGLALIPAGDPTVSEDRVAALRALALLEKAHYDYGAARQDLEAALPLISDPAERIRTLTSLANVTLFQDTAAALARVDEALRIASTQKPDPKLDATLHDLRGRVLLNKGAYAEALVDLKIALKDLGGLTSTTDLNDAVVRGDLALASLKAKQPDNAREYLAMTGQGRLPDGPFAGPADTPVPPCGGNIRPDDVVVVEFGIRDDGRVSFATPVYASRSGPIASEFARAVSAWTWRASDVMAIPLFYRALTRIELRCSNAIERPSDDTLLFPMFEQWLASKQVQPVATDVLEDIAALRGELTRRSGGKAIDQLPVLVAINARPNAELKERMGALSLALKIAEENDAPISAITMLNIRLAGQRATSGFRTKARFADLRKLLNDPAVDADPASSGVLRLALANPPYEQPPADAEQLLRHVAEDARLNPRDPLRVGALVRLSSLLVRRGDIDAARATYLQTGLDAKQCSLVDAQPIVQRSGWREGDYPEEVLRLGIDGWTQIEFDVLPDGRTANQRAIMSYPPFVFGDPAIQTMERTRFTQTYRPEGAIGCSGASRRVRYIMPDRGHGVS